MNKKRVLKIFVILLVIVLLIVIGFFAYDKLFNKPKKEIQEVKVEDKVEDYGYELDDNETKYYKDLFKELKEVLNSEEVDYEEYASILSKLFIADFFNLDNKISNSDIGGINFVYTDYQETFMKFAKDSIYHTVKSNLYGDREQTLPVVTDVLVDKVKQSSISYLKTKDPEGYIVDVTISYKEDLGYQEKATLYLVHSENKLEIVKMSK